MINTENAVVLLVDVQGKLAQKVAGSEDLHQKIAQLLRACQHFDVPVVWVEQLPNKLGPTTSSLADLMPNNTPIAKQTFSAYAHPEVEKNLTELNRKQVILCGIETHICVYQTACDLLREHYHVHVVTDATSSCQSSHYHSGITMMRQHGAWITVVEALLFEWQQQAGEPDFKSFLSLIN
ncbi:isochorismatase family protein [Salinivibrio sp. ES.052]|uniref:isochorismatase family protein n=1 Tax=Salinivibrio sp. ES.052 TaxID=1882823 RepID=UPI00092BF99C|nr:isochorismatase family protein [Salinivibrio sp. ES.052]SIO33695.1 Nicotinamidase-related amidase [Salinivibrio sp. ES.052]